MLTIIIIAVENGWSHVPWTPTLSPYKEKKTWFVVEPDQVFLTTRSHKAGSKDPGKQELGSQSYKDVSASFARLFPQLLSMWIRTHQKPRPPVGTSFSMKHAVQRGDAGDWGVRNFRLHYILFIKFSWTPTILHIASDPIEHPLAPWRPPHPIFRTTVAVITSFASSLPMFSLPCPSLCLPRMLSG